ncbi:MAG TPA: C39 family peptidase [bacterium]|nr:C39 family peptidase [bacterium]
MKTKMLILALVMVIVVNTTIFPLEKKLAVPFYSQKNSEWSDELIGLGGCAETIGSHGCFITSAAMVLKYYDIDFNPRTFNDWLKNDGISGYVDCEFRYGVIEEKNLHYCRKFTSEILPDQIAYEIDQGNPVIALVTLNVTHWYVIVGYERTENGGLSWYINDPWLGDGPTKSNYLLEGNYRFFSAPNLAEEFIGLLPGNIWHATATPLFKAAYNSSMGFPFDNGGSIYAHYWNEILIQDFRTSNGQISHLVFNDYQDQAHPIKGANAAFWFNHFGELGNYPPIDQEKEYYYVGTTNDFLTFGQKCVVLEVGTTENEYPQKTIVWNSKTSAHFPVGVFTATVPIGGYGKIFVGSSQVSLPNSRIGNSNQMSWLVEEGSHTFVIYRSDGTTYGQGVTCATWEGNEQTYEPTVEEPIDPVDPVDPGTNPKGELYVSDASWDSGYEASEKRIVIANNGQGPLNVTIINSCPGLNLNFSNKVFAPGERLELIITIDRSKIDFKGEQHQMFNINIDSDNGDCAICVVVGNPALAPGSTPPEPVLLAGWQKELHANNQATFNVDQEANHITVIQLEADYSKLPYKVQIKKSITDLKNNTRYRLTFVAKGTLPWIVAEVAKAEYDWATYMHETASLGSDWNFYAYIFTAPDWVIANSKINFQCGSGLGEVWIKDINLAEFSFPTSVDELQNNNLKPAFFCYPNPFNSNIHIQFYLSQGEKIFLAVYNLKGEQVAMLSNSYYQSGYYSLNWLAINEPSGVYFVVLKTQDKKEVIKVVLQK